MMMMIMMMMTNRHVRLRQWWSVVSLALVSPGATTDGVTPIVFLKKLATFCYSLPSVKGVTPHLFTGQTSFDHYSL